MTQEADAQALADRFPRDFVWGAATAAYQIEGAVHEDGRGESIWDRFSHTPGKIVNGDTGDVADDHYHRWRDDVALMRQLGLAAYRFSMAWPRILPEGTGKVNEAGLAWYERLVDGLLEAGIQPWATLYHWDLPQVLQDRGGWADASIVNAFVEYADTVARRLGDRVAGWITHNEPWVVAFIGNHEGRHAPGLTDITTALQVAHHLLISHGRAVPLLRSASPRAKVGITLNLNKAYPATDSAEDAGAAQRADGNLNRWFLDPLFGRGYPKDMRDVYAAYLAGVDVDAVREAAVELDFLGVNSYFPSYVRAVPAGTGREWGADSLGPHELAQRGYELTAMGWPVVADALRELLVWVHQTYAPPALYVTENGAAFDDQLVEGAVHDPRRIAYLSSHVAAVAAAIREGSPVRGYFVWSLLDNFEWGLGYSKRFGVVYVDYGTQRRILKDSGHWYHALVEKG